MKRQKLPARGYNERKSARRLLSFFKAGDGRKLCEDTGNNILQRNKRVRPVRQTMRVLNYKREKYR